MRKKCLRQFALTPPARKECDSKRRQKIQRVCTLTGVTITPQIDRGNLKFVKPGFATNNIG
eukprot:1179196-Prorocentrum_minimum.AAC.4